METDPRIAAFLAELELIKHVAAFFENDVQYASLPSLTDKRLQEVGVASRAERRKILAAVAEPGRFDGPGRLSAVAFAPVRQGARGVELAHGLVPESPPSVQAGPWGVPPVAGEPEPPPGVHADLWAPSSGGWLDGERFASPAQVEALAPRTSRARSRSRSGRDVSGQDEAAWSGDRAATGRGLEAFDASELSPSRRRDTTVQGAFAPGGVVGQGRYRVEALLGKGGMGSVYAATELTLGRKVALKVLLPELSNHPTARQRMEGEARALARISSPHVVRLNTVFDEGGLLVLDLEFVGGGALENQLDNDRDGVDESTARAWASQILRGLEAMHAQGLVHRDLKPANILLDEHGTLKVTDLGIAQDSHRAGSLRTRHDANLGTAEYMAPEQIQSAAAVDARADVYAVGVILYQLVTGRVPFEGGEFEVKAGHVQRSPDMAPVRARAPGLAPVIACALAKDPDARFASASDFRAALFGATVPAARATPRALATFAPQSGPGAPAFDLAGWLGTNLGIFYAWLVRGRSGSADEKFLRALAALFVLALVGGMLRSCFSRAEPRYPYGERAPGPPPALAQRAEPCSPDAAVASCTEDTSRLG
jgi:hypothetical protein